MIKFIYFDVGGVVVKDFTATQHWVALKRDIGIKPEKDMVFDKFFDKYESEACVGKDIETLIPLIEKEFGVEIPSEYSFLGYFVDWFEKNESIWPVIDKAKIKYKIGLLTNMYPRMLDLIGKRGLMPDVKWDVVIDSSVEKVLKPQKEIYDLALQKAGVDVSEILFVENSQGHVEVARELGWQTFLFDSKKYKKSSFKLAKMIL